ncbi:MAG: hypothetical protein EP343_20710, partial [Deltaproteobacteria bacterium]
MDRFSQHQSGSLLNHPTPFSASQRISRIITLCFSMLFWVTVSFTALTVWNGVGEAQALPTCNSSYYNYRRCSGNYRYRCDRRTEVYYYYTSCGWLGWSSCRQTGYRYVYYWTLDSTSSSYNYCQYGCYDSGSQAYCRCSNGYANGEEWCSGNYRYKCNASTYRYGASGYADGSSNYYYCQYGCYTYSGRRAYCRCSGGYSYNQEYCSGPNKYRCNLTTYRYGSTSSIGYCPCNHGGATRNVGTYWCYNNYRYYCNNGTVQQQNICSYGCYQSGTQAYCRCPGGLTGGGYYCYNNYKYYCTGGDTTSDGNLT